MRVGVNGCRCGRLLQATAPTLAKYRCGKHSEGGATQLVLIVREIVRKSPKAPGVQRLKWQLEGFHPGPSFYRVCIGSADPRATFRNSLLLRNPGDR